MENENLTKLTKGILQIKSTLPVPIKNWCVGDDCTIIHEFQYKICRYVGNSCRVIGTCSDFADAISRLVYWRDWYKTNEIFLVRCYIEVLKMDK